MRLTAIFCFGLAMSVSARSLSQQITFKASDTPLKDALAAIKQQAGYFIIYKLALLDKAKPVTVTADHMPVEEFLQTILLGQGLSYTIEANTVVIRAVIPAHVTATAMDSLTFFPITGTVRGMRGEPLAGVNVTIKGSKRGTTTDAKGMFKLDAPPGTTLAFSSIGYQSKEVRVTGSGIFNIQLEQSESKLDEVQVIAYGTTTRRLNTGNISKVTGEEIAQQPVGNVLAALDGLVPGMLVTQSSGLPGAGFKVQVRGRTAIDRTLTDDQPLFVIDGVPYAPNNGFLNGVSSALGNPDTRYGIQYNTGGVSALGMLNAQNIESIEVLKDGDATAIYGSRGANGVVLITTKKGRAASGKTMVEFNTYNGWNKAPNLVPMMNTKQYLAIRRQAFINDGEAMDDDNAYDLRLWDTTRYTNFPKLVADNDAYTNDAQLSVSSGNANTQFLVQGAYHRETNVFSSKLSDQRASVNFSINHHSADNRFRLDFTGGYSSDKNKLIGTNIAQFFNLIPNLKVYNGDGSLAWNEAGITNYGNPLAYFNQQYVSYNKNLLSNLLIGYQITKDLVVRSSFGYNTVDGNEIKISPGSMQSPENQDIRYTDFNQSSSSSWIIEPQAEYTHLIFGGKLNILAGGTWQSNNAKSSYVQAGGYGSDELMNSLAGAASIYADRTQSDYHYQAAFGRVNYNWYDKYIINASLRRDGSSRFGSGRQFTTFTSLGLGWIFTNEAWLKNKPGFLSFGKLRASYGLTGNDKISDYQFLDTWTAAENNYNGTSGLYPDKLFNPDYRWEKTTKLEAGLELGFFKDQLLASVSYYRNRSSNQLVNYKLAGTAGFSSIVANLNALVQNTGLEIVLSSTNLVRKDFKWTSSVNLTFPKNKLVSFPGLASSSYSYTYEEGKSLNIIKDRYRYTGLNTQTGLYTFQDINHDGLIDGKDRTSIGDLDAVFFGGLKNSIQYKRVQLDFLFSFRKQTGANYKSIASSSSGDGGTTNLPAVMFGQFWEKPGDNTTFQKLSQSYSSPSYTTFDQYHVSDAMFSDASFIRLRNVAISYNLNPVWIKHLSLTQARLYLQAQNLFMITPYEVGDPELQTFQSIPPVRTIVFGLQINL